MTCHAAYPISLLYKLDYNIKSTLFNCLIYRPYLRIIQTVFYICRVHIFCIAALFNAYVSIFLDLKADFVV